MNRRLLATFAILLLLGPPAFGGSHDERQIGWNDLQLIVGRNVRIVMPDGTRIEGKAIAVEPDALTLDVNKTTNTTAFAKGKRLVPRAALQTFDISHPTHRWRIGGAALGGLLGMIGAGPLESKSSGGYWAAASAVSIAGYFLGRQGDQRVTTYVITQ